MTITVANKVKKFVTSHPLEDCSNWLYHHSKLLFNVHVLTGEKAIRDMKNVGIKQIDKSYYAGAMATLRKLHDMSLDSFYDSRDYEKVSLRNLKHRLLRLPGSLKIKRV